MHFPSDPSQNSYRGKRVPVWDGALKVKHIAQAALSVLNTTRYTSAAATSQTLELSATVGSTWGKWKVSVRWAQLLDDYFKKMYFMYLFLQRGEWRETERERNINVWLPLMRPLLGTWPATKACALIGNPTRDPEVHRRARNLLSYTS